MKTTYLFEGHRGNPRLESSLLLLESAGRDLERATQRLRERLDRLALVTSREH